MRLVRLIFATLALAASPALSAAPCAGFNDVSDTDAFCVNVEWIKNRGVTLGCDTGLYCPNQPVTRLQMAIFMNRLGNVTFLQGGNAFGASAVLGTIDNQPLDIRVNAQRVTRYVPNAISPNVIGGSPANTIDPAIRGSTISGGGASPGTDPDFADEAANRVSGHYGVVGGGYGNNAGFFQDDTFATVGGGAGNLASGEYSTISGGRKNSATGFAAVGGGDGNRASSPYATIGGGTGNMGFNNSSVIGGGVGNTAGGGASAIGGGARNVANGDYSTISGGESNVAGGVFAGSGSWSTVAGGRANTASGPHSTVARGSGNHATGEYSFAAGRRAEAVTNGCFVWGDNSTSQPVTCWENNQFIARALGGFYFVTQGSSNPTYGGAVLPPGGNAWANLSDRAAKENVRDIDTRALLEKLVAMPVSSWNLKSQDSAIRHMGPMAQDFHAAFGIGESDLRISTADADGVALAAIQGLNAKLEERLATKDAEIATLRAELVELRTLRVEVAAIRAALPSASTVAVSARP